MSRQAPLIVLADDDEAVRYAAAAALSGAGYRLASFGDGRTALDFLTSGEATPELLIVDVNMPIMGGWELMRIVACYRRLDDIPILVITAEDLDERAAKTVAGVLRKPFQPSELLDVVSRLVPQLRSVG